MKLASLFLVLSLAACAADSADGPTGDVSGALSVPEALFEYTAEGSGIPFVVFSGSENIGSALYTDDLRRRLNLIHADPSKIEAGTLQALTLDDVIEDVERVRLALGVEKIAVMGHSMFGPVPLEYALKYPDHTLASIVTGGLPRTTSAALEQIPAYWETHASDERKAILEANNAELAQRDPSGVSPSDLFWDQYEADVPFRFVDPEFDFAPFRQSVTTALNVDFLNHFWGVLMHEFDHTSDYGAIRTPVLVVAGRYDFGAPWTLWEEVMELMPDFDFHLFENAGHNPMLEVPEEFDRVVFEWIDSWY